MLSRAWSEHEREHEHEDTLTNNGASRFDSKGQVKSRSAGEEGKGREGKVQYSSFAAQVHHGKHAGASRGTEYLRYIMPAVGMQLL